MGSGHGARWAALSIDPFDEPNVQESKDNTARILEAFQSSGDMPCGSPRLSEFGIDLYAQGQPANAISTLQLAPALGAFLAERQPDDYLAILAYLSRDAANSAELDALRSVLERNLGIPVLLGFGPRYMHSIGQLYKGGPASGMFIVLTSEKKEDVPIPGAKYTFAQLEMAQALGDMQSLASRGKPALRLHLREGAGRGLAELRKTIDQVLAASPSAGS